MGHTSLFWFRLHCGFHGGTHFLVEHEQVLYPFAFGSEPGAAIELVYGAVEGLVGLAEIGWHGVGIVEVGQRGVRVGNAGVEYSLCQRHQF